jgi:hypothetical protein
VMKSGLGNVGHGNSGTRFEARENSKPGARHEAPGARHELRA